MTANNELTPYQGAGQPSAYDEAAHVPRGSDDGRPVEAPTWQPYLYALWRYKWLVLAGLVLGVAAGYGAVRFIAPVYTAEATVWIENVPDPRGGARNQAGPIATEELLTSYAWLDLLTSYEVTEPVVLGMGRFLSVVEPGTDSIFEGAGARRDLHPGLYTLSVGNDGRYTLSDAADRVLESGTAGDSIGVGLGMIWQPSATVLRPGTNVSFQLNSPREAAMGLSGRLNPSLDPGGHFLRVSLNDTDPDRAARVLNAVVARFVSVAGELKREKLEQLTAILETQLAVAHANLRESEGALQGFRVSTITLPGEMGAPVSAGLEETRDPVMQDFFDKKLQIEQLRRDQDAIRRTLASAGPEGTPTAALEAIQSVANASELNTALQSITVKRAELRALLLRYTPDHPAVQTLQEDITQLQQQTIPALANALLANLEAQENQLNELVSSASVQLQQIPARSIEEGRLARAVATAEDLYTQLQQRYEEARLAALSSISDVRVLDQARVPTRPSSNQRPRMFLVATMGGLGLGFAAAILLGIIDSRVRFPHQVTDGLGLPILGALPRFSRNKGALGSDDLIQVLEALRSIRLSLSHSFGAAGPLISVVTSTGAGDGKSFVTSNLGLAFAELGKRTIIIDADIRRGTLHTLTGVPRKPGLCDYLVSNAPLGDVILSTSHAGLDVIPRGSSLTNGPELLASGTMRELLADLRQRYDVILLDSSPLGAAADALVLGTLTGNLVMVVRNDVTDKTLAEAQLRNVDRLPIRILGAVLNAVPRNGVYRYYSYIPNYGTLVSEGAIAALGRDSGNGADSGNGHSGRPNGSGRS